ncbi:DUF2793 domain-containing protein [Pseudogemmobacter blasticus]|uniref:SO2946-like C-terminal domain-containing protein n=1 Tax=Fuscovulum blasticum DSM 2131 TaxID=1188250 RepID=A0A2T4J7L4_FUSBL|nr:DUF2793 domain-containing protein [Fuscovulum blasticum]PTE13896.1 hypothetical protein C5F44_11270 [Fuscovulum blasticum DSM 2131]
MADDTTILGLPLILPNQAQKHVTHNEALAVLDVIVQLAVIDRDRILPPALPALGDRHIVAPGGQVDWAGQDGRVAVMTAAGWQFHAPLPGWQAHVISEGVTAVFDGLHWGVPVAAEGAFQRLGIATGADAVNRLAVAAPATLFTHAGAGHQMKLNKAAPADTASLLFQTGWSGRAEMGTAGGEDFSIKVSADGSGWFSALVAAAGSGEVTLPQPLHLGGQAADPVAPQDGTLWLNTASGEVKMRSAGRTEVLAGRQAPLGLWDWWYDLRLGSTTVSASDLFLGAAISSGTNTTAVPATARKGFNPLGVFLRSSTSANGGYRYVAPSTSGGNNFYCGAVALKFRAQFQWLTDFTGRTVRAGLHSTTNAVDAQHGVYFEVLGDQLVGKTAANNVRSSTAALTLALGVAYTMDVEVNAAGTAARFRVWADAEETAVLDQTLTTNIPANPAYVVAAAFVATEVSTTASDIGVLYSLGVGTVAGCDRQRG